MMKVKTLVSKKNLNANAWQELLKLFYFLGCTGNEKIFTDNWQ